MKYEITILSVKDSEKPNTMSVLRTNMRGLTQTASVAKERADLLQPHIGKTMSLDDFFDLLNEPIIEGGPRNLSMAGSAVEEKRRILIVDDDRDSTHLTQILLEKTGRYLVLEESDATKAHQSARNFKPDLILLDIMMPQRDGGDIAAQIEADPGLQRTPILFLTALVTKDEAKAGLRIQGHPVLAKPINIPELINEIEENLPARATPEGAER
jgi:CheY-like chemotaxis protein